MTLICISASNLLSQDLQKPVFMSFVLCHPGLLKAACKLLFANSFLISATNLIMVTLGNGSMRSQVVALNFSIKGQVLLIFNPLTAAAASYLMLLPQASPQETCGLGMSCGFFCLYFGAVSFRSLLKCMCLSSFKVIISIKKLMITIPGLLFPNKDDSSDTSHYVADSKIATFRHVFMLGLDFLAATIHKRETVGNFLL